MTDLNFFRPPADAKVQFLVGEYGIPAEPVLTVLKARSDDKPPKFYWDEHGLHNFLRDALCEYPAAPQHVAKIIDKDAGRPTGQVAYLSDTLVTKLKKLAADGGDHA